MSDLYGNDRVHFNIAQVATRLPRSYTGRINYEQNTKGAA